MMTSDYHFAVNLIKHITFCLLNGHTHTQKYRKKNQRNNIHDFSSVALTAAEEKTVRFTQIYKYVWIYMLIICSKILNAGMNPFGTTRMCKEICWIRCCCCCLCFIFLLHLLLLIFAVVNFVYAFSIQFLFLFRVTIYRSHAHSNSVCIAPNSDTVRA